MTGLIHSFCVPFDESTVIEKMRTGRRWPRPGYLRNPVDPTIMIALKSVSGSTTLLQRLTAREPSEDEICGAAIELTRRVPDAKGLIDQLSLSPEEISAMWETNRILAARQGTWMHWRFEAYLNRVPVPQAGNAQTCITNRVMSAQKPMPLPKKVFCRVCVFGWIV